MFFPACMSSYALVDLVERVGGGDEFVELEPTRLVQLEQARDVALGADSPNSEPCSRFWKRVSSPRGSARRHP